MKRKVIWNNKLLISITVLIILMAGSINLYKQYGPIVEGFNGTQTYLKTNPAIAQKVTISRAIIALGKDLNLDDLNGKVVTDNQDDYDESDLT